MSLQYVTEVSTVSVEVEAAGKYPECVLSVSEDVCWSAIVRRGHAVGGVS